MNELLHKFKLGNDAELLLEKRGGGYEKVATVPIGSQALGVTQSAQGIALTTDVGNIGIPGSSIESPQRSLPCFEILEYFNLYDWGRDASAGLTIEIDEAVKWQDRPTVKITIPAGQSGGKYIFGTNTYSTAKFPLDFDGNNLAIVASISDPSKIYNGLINFEYGDSTMLNRWTQPIPFSGYGPGDWVRAGEWVVLKPNDGTRATTGAPEIAQRMRARGQITIVGTLTEPLVIRVAMIGVMRKQKKPILGWTLDDWDAGWWKYYWPVARYYEIPTTIQLCAGAGTILDVDRKNIRAMRDDPSRLVSFANHARLHSRYKVDSGAVTADEMLGLYTSNEINVANLGGSKFEQKFASYPNGAYDQALIDALIGAGYYGARGTENLEPQQKTGLFGVGDRSIFQLPLITQVNETLTAQQTIDALTAWFPSDRFGTCLSHHIGLVDAAQVADVKKIETVFSWLREQADAGTIELKSMIRHCAESLNVPTDRR